MDNIPSAVSSEVELIEKSRSGDHRAFTELVHRYEDMVYGFAFKVCRDPEKAVDSMQTTFVNMYRKLYQFDGKSKLSTWLYSIVVNSCFMQQRVRKLDASAVDIDVLDSHSAQQQSITPTPLDEMMNKEMKQKLDSAILKLPVDYRIVFVLRDIEGLSAQETAEALDLSIPAVKSRLHRARFFLREQLHSYLGEQ